MRKKILAMIALIVFLAAVMFIILTYRPDIYLSLMQSHGFVEGEVNSYDAENQNAVKTLKTGITCIENIDYGSKYPNGFLDLYRTDVDEPENAPLFFYIHGGGYVGGDKSQGDPAAASGTEDATKYLQEICKSGYNVVSINYALSPEYNYPIPIYQIDEAVHFLIENEETYGIDTSRFVFSGGSAGGQLAGQYVNIQTNKEYAEKMNMEVLSTEKKVMGVVFNCALLQPENFAKTNSITNNFMFYAMRQQYFGGKQQIYDEADVILNLSENFPPAYITDGNYATFNRQADALDQALDKLEIDHIYNYYDRKQARLNHGYDSYLDNEFAQDNLEKVLDFLKELKDT